MTIKSKQTKRTAKARADSLQRLVRRNVCDSANEIAREVADWIAEDGVIYVHLSPDEIEVWVNGEPVKDVKWGDLLESGITLGIECGRHKESRKQYAAFAAKLKKAAKIIDDALAPNDDYANQH